jgi:D-alanine-D-alanine ligase
MLPPFIFIELRMKHLHKTRIALFFGGESSEHEVSIQSAKNIFIALNAEKYQVILVYISKSGRFFVCQDSDLVHTHAITETVEDILQDDENEITVVMGGHGKCIYINDLQRELHIDCAFPILHGAFGEDGSIQGLFKMAGIPFVGSGILGSAVGMDKDVAKRLLRDGGFSIAKFIVIKKHEIESVNFLSIQDKLGLPLFVKPANAGSSVGVSKVKNEEEFFQAMKDAFQYDMKILIEEAIVGQEIECAVLGNDNPKASALGEVIPTQGFYSYNAKYIDSEGALLKIPANIISETLVRDIQGIAVDVFKCLECAGMTRVDFFITKEDKIYINEVNTIPGFTSVSMYPKLWEVSGIGYSKLLDAIIEFGMEGR